MWLIVDRSLAAGFIPINTRQQRASLPFTPGGSNRFGDITVMLWLPKFLSPFEVGGILFWHRECMDACVHFIC